MAKKLKQENIDDIIKELEQQKELVQKKIETKINEYDAKAKEKRDAFMNQTITPLQKEVAELKEDIAKYQKVKTILG